MIRFFSLATGLAAIMAVSASPDHFQSRRHFLAAVRLGRRRQCHLQRSGPATGFAGYLHTTGRDVLQSVLCGNNACHHGLLSAGQDVLPSHTRDRLLRATSDRLLHATSDYLLPHTCATSNYLLRSDERPLRRDVLFQGLRSSCDDLLSTRDDNHSKDVLLRSLVARHNRISGAADIGSRMWMQWRQIALVAAVGRVFRELARAETCQETVA